MGNIKIQASTSEEPDERSCSSPLWDITHEINCAEYLLSDAAGTDNKIDNADGDKRVRSQSSSIILNENPPQKKRKRIKIKDWTTSHKILEVH